MTADRPATDPRTPSVQDHWMEPFGETVALVCHCGDWQWDGFGDSPAILFTDPVVQHSWWAHVTATIVTGNAFARAERDRAEAAQGAAPRAGHDITDPNAPIGWQCGDPACPVHGLQGAAPRAEGLDVERLNQAIARVVGPSMSLTLGRTRAFVDMVAIEYARLSRPSDEREGDPR